MTVVAALAAAVSWRRAYWLCFLTQGQRCAAGGGAAPAAAASSSRVAATAAAATVAAARRCSARRITACVAALIRDGKSVRPTALEYAYPLPDPSLQLHRCASNFEAETTAAETATAASAIECSRRLWRRQQGGFGAAWRLLKTLPGALWHLGPGRPCVFACFF